METPERDETHIEQHGDGDVNLDVSQEPVQPEPSEPEPAEDPANDED